MVNQPLELSVSDFLALTNQILDNAYPSVAVVGEVASFKVNQGKYVFFDLKDERGTVSCFMTVYNLRQPIEDGMRLIVVANPKLTAWGKFSLTVKAYRMIGEGDLQRSASLLERKLKQEGLFDDDRKRHLPVMPKRVAVISSTDAAGYKDFIKILNDRWSGLEVEVAHVQVQGIGAADQVIQALNYCNQMPHEPEVIVIIRGGGSADDLSTFNDELLVRAIAASRIPVLTGIGHEVDTTLADLAADVRAATPSNAAQILVPDKRDVIARLSTDIHRIRRAYQAMIDSQIREVGALVDRIDSLIDQRLQSSVEQLKHIEGVMRAYDPKLVLKRGYAIVRGDPVVGEKLEILREKDTIIAEVVNVKQR